MLGVEVENRQILKTFFHQNKREDVMFFGLFDLLGQNRVDQRIGPEIHDLFKTADST